MKHQCFYLLFVLFLWSNIIFAQSALQSARKLYDAGKYESALTFFEEASAQTTDFDESDKIKIADCYYYTHRYYKAKSYFEQVNLANMNNETLFRYARVMQNTGSYEQAVEIFKQIQTDGYKHPALNTYIDACKWAQTNLSRCDNDARVRSFNKGLNYRWAAACYYDNGILFSVANKQGNADWAYARFLNDTLSTPTTFDPTLNTNNDDWYASFDTAQRVMVFTVTKNVKNKTIHQLYRAEKKNGKWSQPVAMVINDDNYSCMHPTLSANGNQIYFASDMAGGNGGFDIYMTQFVNSEWTIPQNAGKAVNTTSDELYPYLQGDSVLYFASDGWEGYGGFDIFKYNTLAYNTTKPTNIGLPANSSADDWGLNVIQYDKNTHDCMLISNRTNDEFFPYIISCSQKSNKNIVMMGQANTGQDTQSVPRDILVLVTDNTTTNNKINIKNSATKTQLVYRIQIMATATPHDVKSPIFKGLNIDRYKVNYLYKYTTGLFTDSIDAEKNRQLIADKGFKDAFVVKYEQRDLDKANRTNSDLATNSSFQEQGVLYRVQFKSSVEALQKLPVIENHFAVRYRYQGMYRYTIGEFTDKEDAIILLDKVKQMGYHDAFVAAFKDGERSLDIKIYDKNNQKR